LCVDVCVISAVLFLVGDSIYHPLSQQVKTDEIAKNMIPNANSAERNPKAQCVIRKENTDHVYIFTRKVMLPCVAHTFTKTLCVYYL
jgi:hypothetical protein